MQMSARARRMGKVLVALALLLIVGIGGITVLLAPGLLAVENRLWGPTFDGTRRQGAYVLMTLSLVMVFGFNALLAGLWQIKKGRKSMLFFYTSIALAFAILGAMGAVSKEFDNSGRTSGHDAIEHPKEYALKVADELNTRLPRMLDKQTRIERVTAGPGQTVNFTFTLMRFSSADSKREAPAFMAGVIRDLKRQQCAQPVVRDAFQHGAAVNEKWIGSDGGPVAELHLTAEECNEDRSAGGDRSRER